MLRLIRTFPSTSSFSILAFKVRLIREGIVIYTGKLGSLRRFDNDVKEVINGYECGMTIENFNDIKVGDIIEGFEDQEVEE